MNMTVMKEKPDLLFNNPLKQKVYLFLKNNPGKDFETFQVLTGDAVVSRQHFNEVEQAIKSREEREKARTGSEKVNSLFLLGGPFDRPRAASADNTEVKDSMLKKIDKKKLNEKAKQYIKEHPGCTYDELVKNLDFKELSKPHFFSMKTQLRKKGEIPEESRTRRGRKTGEKKTQSAPREFHATASSHSKTIEILDSIDTTGFSNEIREHYKSHVLPLLQKLMPQGEKLKMVFLSDPPTIELRREVVR
ncbi:MAG: hypothetical protein M3Y08_12975 [Fibrobacterota bacterium]|nr:hypothetical protein [Fibrobacterota bacterium]